VALVVVVVSLLAQALLVRVSLAGVLVPAILVVVAVTLLWVLAAVAVLVGLGGLDSIQASPARQ